MGIVVAGGGRSARFGRENKLLCPLAGIPVVVRALQALSPFARPGMTVLAVPKTEQNRFREVLAAHGLNGVRMVAGGDDRQLSVLRALENLPAEAEWVAVHDAARPFPSPASIRKCIRAAREHGAAAVARRVTDTIREADAAGRAVRTLDRSRLWAAETPQVFRTARVLAALRKVSARGIQVTDEAAAFEHCGWPVRLVEAEGYNPKLTSPRDLPFLEFLVREAKDKRTA